MVTGVLFGILTCLCPFATGLLLYLLAASFFREVAGFVESQNVDFPVREELTGTGLTRADLSEKTPILWKKGF